MGKINFALAAALIAVISNVGLTSVASADVSDGKEDAAPSQAPPAFPKWENSRSERQSSLDDYKASYNKAVSTAMDMPPRMVKLFTFKDGGRATVVRLAEIPPAVGCTDGPESSCVSARRVFVAVPAQLRSFCSASNDVLIALEMALGLPPQPQESLNLFLFDVDTSSLRRPCSNEPTAGMESCSIPTRSELATLRRKYGGDGYPFTGMGWTFNWNPQVLDHVGVSEFILTDGAPIFGAVARITVREFCSGGQHVSAKNGN